LYLSEKLRDYLSKKDPYFGGEDNNDRDQPEIKEDDLPKDGGI